MCRRSYRRQDSEGVGERPGVREHQVADGVDQERPQAIVAGCQARGANIHLSRYRNPAGNAQPLVEDGPHRLVIGVQQGQPQLGAEGSGGAVRDLNRCSHRLSWMYLPRIDAQGEGPQALHKLAGQLGRRQGWRRRRWPWGNNCYLPHHIGQVVKNLRVEDSG